MGELIDETQNQKTSLNAGKTCRLMPEKLKGQTFQALKFLNENIKKAEEESPW